MHIYKVCVCIKNCKIVMGACGSGQRVSFFFFCAIFFVALLKLQFSFAVLSFSAFCFFFRRAAHPAQKVHEKRRNGTTTIYLLPLLYFLFTFCCPESGKSRRGAQNKSDSRTDSQSFEHFSHSVSC